MTTPDTRRIMHTVLLALLPGVALQCYWFGLGTLTNLGVAVGFGLLTELLLLRFRGLAVLPALTDGTTLVTCSLIAIALPPATAWPILLIACTAALGLGKHAYGGTGYNLFNPAMVGYAVVLVSFPAALGWPAISGLDIDAATGPTLLESFKYRAGQTVAEVWQAQAGFGRFGGLGVEWVNLGYLLGGLLLLIWRIIDWRIPVAMLFGMAAIATLGYDGGSSASLGSPVMHWFSGATMLTAFFIATDPVTCPSSAIGRLLFGALIGMLIMMIRGWGGYPDGVAFAVLLGNAAAPLIDRYAGVVGRERDPPPDLLQ